MSRVGSCPCLSPGRNGAPPSPGHVSHLAGPASPPLRRHGSLSPALNSGGARGGGSRGGDGGTGGVMPLCGVASPSPPRGVCAPPIESRSVRAASERTSWAATSCGAQHTQQQRLTLPPRAGTLSPPARERGASFSGHPLTAANLASISEQSSHRSECSSSTAPAPSRGSASLVRSPHANRQHACLRHESLSPRSPPRSPRGSSCSRDGPSPRPSSWRDEVGGYPLL